MQQVHFFQYVYHKNYSHSDAFDILQIRLYTRYKRVGVLLRELSYYTCKSGLCFMVLRFFSSFFGVDKVVDLSVEKRGYPLRWVIQERVYTKSRRRCGI